MRRTGLAVLLLFVSAGDATASGEDGGRQLFEARCDAVCHQLPEPASLKPTQWPVVLKTMQRRMQQSGMTPLAEEEFDQLLNYLVAHARREP